VLQSIVKRGILAELCLLLCLTFAFVGSRIASAQDLGGTGCKMNRDGSCSGTCPAGECCNFSPDQTSCSCYLANGC
jgi:hypothetical protein